MDVGDWLRGLGLGQYETLFRQNDIDAEVLSELTDGDLEKFGVSFGHRKRLLKAIVSLGSTETSAKPPAPLPPQSSTAAERRQLTVMFCDLVGSTAMSARLDPEDMREVIRAYQDACSGAVARYDGFVAKFMGDGVLAYFGFPRAHEEDAERAVRAGLDIVAVAAKLETAGREPLRVRIGIATGIVVVGDLVGQGSAQEQAVVGETPNLAARLQALAEPGSIVIAEATRRLLGGTFELKPLGPQTLKGFDAFVFAWKVLLEAENVSRFEASRSQRLTAFVGREHEVALLLDRWRDASEGEGQIALLSGEAGIGKSRTLEALREKIGDEPHIVTRYQCSPHHINDAFHPIAGQIWRAAGFVNGEPAVERLDKLQALIGGSSLDAEHTMYLLASLLSIPHEGRYAELQMAPSDQKERTIAALVGLFEGLTKNAPVLALLEDAHWIDPTSLDVFNRLIDRLPKMRALLVITFRPEFVAPWVGRANVQSISLGRFSHRQTMTMIKNLTGGKALPAEVLRQIVAKTDGIPLFMEELTKTVLESGQLREENGTYLLRAALTPLAIPSTLQDTLMARLDRLAPVKKISQIGAAIGREFSWRLLEAVAPLKGPALQDALGQLVSAELIHASGTPPDATYVFKHALVQDTAYSSLLRSRRQRIHADIARALEGHFANQVEAAPAIIAHHFTEAGMSEIAFEWWSKAGEQSLKRSSIIEASAHFKRAITLADEGVVAPVRERLNLQIAFGQTLLAAKGFGASETAAAFARARELVSEIADADERFSVYFGLWVGSYIRGELAPMRELAENFLSDANQRPDIPEAASAHRVVGLTRWVEADYIGARSHLELALALAKPEFDKAHAFRFGQAPRIAAMLNLPLALGPLGYIDKAHNLLDLAWTEAKDYGHVPTIAYTHGQTCIVEGICGCPDRALGHASSLVDISREHGLQLWEPVAVFFKNWAVWSSGNKDIDVEEMRTALKRFHIGFQPIVPLGAVLLAEVEAEALGISCAISVLDDASVAVQLTGQKWYDAEILRLRGRLLQREKPYVDGMAAAAFERALAVARSQKTKTFELRAATDLARLWRAAGSMNDPRALLEPILVAIGGGENTRDVRNARALLAEMV